MFDASTSQHHPLPAQDELQGLRISSSAAPQVSAAELSEAEAQLAAAQAETKALR